MLPEMRHRLDFARINSKQLPPLRMVSVTAIIFAGMFSERIIARNFISLRRLRQAGHICKTGAVQSVHKAMKLYKATSHQWVTPTANMFNFCYSLLPEMSTL